MSRALREHLADHPLLERRHRRRRAPIDTISQTNGADDAGEQPDERAAADRHRRGLVLLIEIRGQHAAADDPQTAAAVADADDRQRRQDADEETAEQMRLSSTAVGLGLRRWPSQLASRSTRGRGA